MPGLSVHALVPYANLPARYRLFRYTPRPSCGHGRQGRGVRRPFDANSECSGVARAWCPPERKKVLPLQCSSCAILGPDAGKRHGGLTRTLRHRQSSFAGSCKHVRRSPLLVRSKSQSPYISQAIRVSVQSRSPAWSKLLVLTASAPESPQDAPTGPSQ